MDKFWEDLNKLNEDNVIFDDDSPVLVHSYFEKDISQAIDTTIDANAYDITDRGREFVEWLEDVEDDVITEDYVWNWRNLEAYVRLFIEDVLKLNYFGPEMHKHLADYTIQLKLKPFTYKSGVIVPSPRDRQHRGKFILTKTLDRSIILEAQGLGDIRGFIEYFVKAFLVERIPVQTIASAITSFWVYVELPQADDATNDLLKAYLDIKYKNGHKQFEEASRVIQKLRTWLEGASWELMYHKEDNIDQKLILYGTGLTDNLRWLLKGGDIVIKSFYIMGGDL